MWIIHESKFVKIEVDYKSWGICIDWRHENFMRWIYADFLCLHFQFGRDPEAKL